MGMTMMREWKSKLMMQRPKVATCGEMTMSGERSNQWTTETRCAIELEAGQSI